MLLENLDNYFLIFALVIGAFAILLIWTYVFEATKGIYITDLKTFKRYVNCAYVFSLIMLVIMWLTTSNMDQKLINCFWGMSIAWFFTAFISLFVSIFVKGTTENKKNIRLVMFTCIVKVIIMVCVLWLIG